MTRSILFFAIFLTISGPLLAQESERNSAFLNPEMDVSRFVGMFERESREVFAEREQIVGLMDIEPGTVLADIGAGTGAYTDLFSRAVGENGQVFAVEISPRFTEHLRKRADEEDLDNVTVVLSSLTSATLPPDSVDTIFLCDTYHHFDDPAPMLASMLRALRPGGTLFMVEFDRIEGVSREWLLDHVRADKDTFRAEIEKAGFRFAEEIEVEGLKENFMMRFTRP